MIVSPEGRSIIAESLRAVAAVLESRDSGQQGQSTDGTRQAAGSETQDTGGAVSAAGSLAGEMAAAPLEMAAAATGAVGDMMTTALGGSAEGGESSGGGKRGGRRGSARGKSSAVGD